MPQVGKVGKTDVRSNSRIVAASGNIFDDATPVSSLPEIGHKFLVFGISGTGKTTLACTFPKPLLLVRPEEVEDGSRSVRKVQGVSVTPPVVNPDQLLDISMRQRETKRYRTVVVDGIDRFQDLVVKRNMNLEDVPVQNTFGMATDAEWGMVGIALMEYLRGILRLADIGTHVVLVSGERTIKGGKGVDGGVDPSMRAIPPKVMAAMLPSVTGWVHAVCDYNVYTFKRKGFVEEEFEQVVAGKKEIQTRQVPTNNAQFCAIIGPDPENLYSTKFRVDRDTDLPGIMVDPTFSKMEELIRQG